jgi:alpha-tubulin suppressor-like RCC1 family protein
MATRAVLLAAGLLAGCGPTLFGATGVPVVTPTCLDPALPIACLGAEACVAEDDSHCGTGCGNCLGNAIQHGTTFCDRSNLDLAQHACVTSCESGFVRDPNGPGCICDAGQVACGAGGACVAETPAACGASCLSCGAPASATATCANHTCDYICPAGKEQCTNVATGQPDCCVPPCSAQQVQCGGACVSESTTQCGPLCANCNDPSNAVPSNASAACLGSAGHGACTFACNPGFLKSNGACVQVKAGPGAVALGGSHTCVITTAGGVMCWGANGSGQLGVGDTVPRLTPVDVVLAGAATAIAAGASHTCAVTTSGAVQCWGSNVSAQLGQPLTTVSSRVPVTVPAFPPAGNVVTEVTAGAGHTCVILKNNASLNTSAVCWGANDKGQVGIALTASVVTPTTVPNLSGSSVAQIATQVDHTCVVRATNGQVSCWGSNPSGQTGQSPSQTSVPGATVSSLTASAISVGGTHTCAIGQINNNLATQGVYCWGDRSVRQLGDGLTTPNISTPFRATLIDPAASSDRILTGRAHSCAGRAADGTVICAGANSSLQVGVTPPSSSEFATPTPISLGTIDALFGGGDRSCALVTGALKCWGANDHGQLGNNSTVESATPVSPQPF